MFQGGFPAAERPYLLRSARFAVSRKREPLGKAALRSRTKGGIAPIITMRALKIGARDEQRVSANSTYALFARWEMSKRKNKAFAVPERGGTFPLAARDAGSPKSRRFYGGTSRKICEVLFMGIFSKIKEALKKTKENLGGAIKSLFSRNKIGDDFYEELEEILISADISVATAEETVEELRAEVKKEKLKDEEYVVSLLKDILEDTLTRAEVPEIEYPAVIMLIGVNGVGKTTTVGKLADYFLRNKNSVTVAAADTFRAAAADQLTIWAERAGVRIVKHEEGSDPSAVVFDALSSVKAKGTDVLLVDTAGRLHVKSNLMEELKKISRVISREYPQAHVYKLLVLDATTGNNAINQARLFDEAVELDGIVLTKLDSTAKGGFVISLCGELEIPVIFVGTGEKIGDLELFNPEEFIDSIL